MSSEIPVSKLTEVCERAARFHRMQVADRSTPFLLEQEVYVLPNTTIVVGADVWAKVGTVVDGVDNLYLAVWWHPADDKVRLENPPKREFPDLEPTVTSPPLYRTNPTSSKALDRPFTALPGYVYCYGGREYDADKAEEMTAQLGTIERWTWRRARE